MGKKNLYLWPENEAIWETLENRSAVINTILFEMSNWTEEQWSKFEVLKPMSVRLKQENVKTWIMKNPDILAKYLESQD